MNKIKLTKEQLDLFFNYSNIISTSNEEWFNIPFWFKRIDEDTFELFSRNELPKELLETINERNIRAQTFLL